MCNGCSKCHPVLDNSVNYDSVEGIMGELDCQANPKILICNAKGMIHRPAPNELSPLPLEPRAFQTYLR